MNKAEYNSPVSPHLELNPHLWEGNVLRNEVRLSLMKIALEFYHFLNVDTKIVDVVITGSQANYNYSETSDLDLHLIVSYDQIQCQYPVDELFDTKRKLWKEHHDISIHGIDVELYVEDQATPAVSSSYSIINNKWMKPPSKSVNNIDQDKIEAGVIKWSQVIHSAIQYKDLTICRKVKDMIYDYRKMGLAKAGEFSVPNLVFKSLRNSGDIATLMRTIRELYDQSLSI